MLLICLNCGDPFQPLGVRIPEWPYCYKHECRLAQGAAANRRQRGLPDSPRPKTAVCGVCREPFDVQTRRGPVPGTCLKCKPHHYPYQSHRTEKQVDNVKKYPCVKCGHKSINRWYCPSCLGTVSNECTEINGVRP